MYKGESLKRIKHTHTHNTHNTHTHPLPTSLRPTWLPYTSSRPASQSHQDLQVLAVFCHLASQAAPLRPALHGESPTPCRVLGARLGLWMKGLAVVVFTGNRGLQRCQAHSAEFQLPLATSPTPLPFSSLSRRPQLFSTSSTRSPPPACSEQRVGWDLL